VAGRVFVNSEIEGYLRLLQVAGEAPLHPWSLRQLGPREVQAVLPRDPAHPWARRYDFSPDSGRGLRLLPPAARVVENTGFPYGYNDGPVWAGRGITASVEAGVALRMGALSVTLAPQAFFTQNSDFDRPDNGLAGSGAFAAWRSPLRIDLPDRFGDGSYARLDPGESSVRVDVGALAAGVSTASQHWGPAVEHPLVLGNNAGGFPHVFVGTARPVDVGIGRVQGRLAWGSLTQSPYATTNPDSTRRFSAGLALVFTPRGAPGLEVGGGRFFHTAWGEGPEAGDFLRPFQGLLKESLPGGEQVSDPDNQLSSLFFRFVAPRAGLEVYGEYGKEDHNRDFRQLFLIPDNGRAYMFGFRRVWRGGGGRTLTALRGELMNAERPNVQLVLTQGTWYTHSSQRQGHTFVGQALGSAAAFGGAGSTLALDHYARWGRVTVSWVRLLRGNRIASEENQPRENIDVIHALGADGVLFAGAWDVAAGVRVMKNYNRDFLDGDALNVNATLGVRLAR
jgi:hypothetical protein